MAAPHPRSEEGLSPTPPVLAIEIAGEDEDEDVLREKASWYLQHGVRAVWLVLPSAREVVVIEGTGEQRRKKGEAVTGPRELPDLTIAVDALFWQIDRAP